MRQWDMDNGEVRGHAKCEVTKRSLQRSILPRRISAQQIFDSHVSEDVYEHKLATGDLIRGVLHVNAKVPTDAFVKVDGPYIVKTIPEASPPFKEIDYQVEVISDDVYVPGHVYRNRALHDDTVGIELLPKGAWKDFGAGEVKPTGKVSYVEIHEGRGSGRSHFAVLRGNRSREANNELDRNAQDPTFRGELFINWGTDALLKAVPVDKRIPWFVIPMKEIHKIVPRACDKKCRPFEYLIMSDQLPEYQVFEIEMAAWHECSRLPEGRLLRLLGELNTTEVHEEVALTDHKLLKHRDPIPQEVEKWTAKLLANYNDRFPELVKERVDLRHERIFTIDPTTARDLDDAIHVKRIEDSTLGNHLEIGVHIADVSHFVQYDNPIDSIARQRTTTVYFPHKAYHMLPRSLCEQVCSLNRDSAKLTFSCVFFMDYEGRLLADKSPQFFKSVIESKYRLNYDEVQNVLDSGGMGDPLGGKIEAPVYLVPDVDTTKLTMDAEEHRDYPYTDLRSDLILLENVTQRIRKRRFEEGSMELNKVQLRFCCDETTNLPLALAAEVQTTSHQLIEELMLTANRLVARKLINGPVSEAAVIRRHPALDAKKAAGVRSHLEKLKLPSALVTAKDVQETLQTAFKRHGYRVGIAIEQLLVEAMKLASYEAYGAENFPGTLHFALNFDCYTHFTSPIRRYPDILVHRALALTLELEALPEDLQGDSDIKQKGLTVYGLHDILELSRRCSLCNEKKESAKLASEAAGRAWLMMYILQSPKLLATAGTVLEISDRSFMVLLSEFGLKRRIEFTAKASSDEWYKQKVRDQYSAQMKLPSEYTVISDFQAVEVIWSDDVKQRVELWSFVIVYIMPSRQVPLDFVIVPVPPNSEDYKAIAKAEQSRTRRKHSEELATK